MGVGTRLEGVAWSLLLWWHSSAMMLRSSLSLLRRVSGARVCCCRQLQTSGTARMASAKLVVRDETSRVAVCGPFSSFFRALASCLVLKINIRTFDTPPGNHHPLHSLILHRWSTGACRTPRETSHVWLMGHLLLNYLSIYLSDFFLVAKPGSHPQPRESLACENKYMPSRTPSGCSDTTYWVVPRRCDWSIQYSLCSMYIGLWRLMVVSLSLHWLEHRQAQARYPGFRIPSDCHHQIWPMTSKYC